MNGHCSECGQRVDYDISDVCDEDRLLCVACCVAGMRLGRTLVTFCDLDEVYFDPELTDVPPEIAERIRARADQCRL